MQVECYSFLVNYIIHTPSLDLFPASGAGGYGDSREVPATGPNVGPNAGGEVGEDGAGTQDPQGIAQDFIAGTPDPQGIQLFKILKFLYFMYFDSEIIKQQFEEL